MMALFKNGNTGKGLCLTFIIMLIITIFCPFVQANSAGVSGGNDLIVSFIDVGQGDCILIHTPTHQNMLIDAGNREDFPAIRDFLKTQQVSRLDILVATHPHEDHIGSMEQIIRNFGIGKVYMPKVPANTRVFEDLLMAVKDKGLKINTAKVGFSLELAPEIAMQFLAPNSDFYENLNDYSAVIKMSYHKVSFVFAGDAGRISEQEMLTKPADLRANILKVGHHGSSSSSSATFLKQVAPEIAIISVGVNNSYHHPSAATLKRLIKVGAKIYRTDRNGTIQVFTDGYKFNIHCQK